MVCGGGENRLRNVVSLRRTARRGLMTPQATKSSSFGGRREAVWAAVPAEARPSPAEARFSRVRNVLLARITAGKWRSCGLVESTKPRLALSGLASASRSCRKVRRARSPACRGHRHRPRGEAAPGHQHDHGASAAPHHALASHPVSPRGHGATQVTGQPPEGGP